MRVQLLVGDLVEPRDRPAVTARELVEPDVDGLGEQHHARHPVEVAAEALVLVLVPAEARDGAGARVAERGRPRPGRHGRVEAQPHRPLFLLEQVEPGEQPEQRVAEQRAPALADERELALERVGRRQRGRAQHVHQVLLLGAEARARLEVVAQRPGDAGVGGRGREGGVVEQLAKRLEGQVQVREPQHHQFLERHGAVRHVAAQAVQPGGRGEDAAVDGHGGEAVGELEQGAVQRRTPEPGLEPRERVGHGARVALLAVGGHHEVQHLVDEPHGVECAGDHRAFRVRPGLAHGVHAVGERAARLEVGEDDVAGDAEERVVEPVEVARGARHVKLEGGPVAHEARSIAGWGP